jgi:hypothetical protein
MRYHLDVEMGTKLRLGLQSAGVRERLLFVLVILALALNVASRFTFIVPSVGAHPVVTDSARLEQQHLSADAVAWVPPHSELIPFLSAVSTVPLPESDAPHLVLHLDDSLSNRPPPSC